MDNNLKSSEAQCEADSHFAESIVNSVLSCDTDVAAIDAEAIKGSKFNDGFSLINAYKVFKNLKPNKNVVQTKSQKWQIWYWRRGSEHTDRNSWNELLQKKSTFVTRKEFWSAYNEVNGYEFGLLSRHFDYCVFKEGIIPMWEDSANRFGGRWILEFPHRKDWRHISYLDQIWLKVLLAITGTDEDLSQYVDNICGCVLMIRYNTNKIAVWTKNSANTLINLKIAELLKTSTGFPGKMYYISHDSTIKKIEVKAEHRIRFDEKTK